MKYSDAELEQDVLSMIEDSREDGIPIKKPSLVYSILITDVEKITNAIVRQHLRVLLQSVVKN